MANRMHALPGIVLASLPAAASAAVDVLPLWDFAQPEVSEARFREAARDEALAIQRQLERENDAAGTPDPHVYDELAKLHSAKGNAAEAARYGELGARTSRKPGDT